MDKKKILVVDDEKSMRSILEIILKTGGYEVDLAQDGKEALEILKSKGGKADLVLLDMSMPDMSGREVVEKIRAEVDIKDTKIIFLTASKFSGKGKETIEDLDVVDYIVKPFDNNDLLRRVKSALG